MRIIAKKSLVLFWGKHPESQGCMEIWYRTARHCKAKTFNELKQTYNTADYVPSKFTVFDIGGNKYRIVAIILFDKQIIYIRGVFTHVEYDKWTKDNKGK